MEKQFVDLVSHIFTLGWAVWGIPISLLLSFTTKRVLPGFVLAAIAVVLHLAGHLALPILQSGGDMGTLPSLLTAAIQKLEPLSVAADYVAYAFLIIVFCLTRQDMFRPGVEMEKH